MQHIIVQDYDLAILGGIGINTNEVGDSLAIGLLLNHKVDGYGLKESLERAQIYARYTCSVDDNLFLSYDKWQKLIDSFWLV